MATAWADVPRMHPWFRMPSLKRRIPLDAESIQRPPTTEEYDPSLLLPLPKRRRCDTLERRIASLTLNSANATVGVPEPPPTEGLVQLPVPTWDTTGDGLDIDIVLDEPEADVGTLDANAHAPIASTTIPAEDINPASLTVSPTLLSRLKSIGRQQNPLLPLPKPDPSLALVLFRPLTVPSSAVDSERREEGAPDDTVVEENVSEVTSEDAMDVDSCNN